MKALAQRDRAIVKAAFPDYRGRKIRHDWSGEVYISGNFWDGGTRSYWVAVNLATLAVQAAPGDNPYRHVTDGKVAVPQGFVIVEHVIFCGRDCGVCIYWPEAPAMNQIERQAAIRATFEGKVGA